LKIDATFKFSSVDHLHKIPHRLLGQSKLNIIISSTILKISAR
jgi:hypothetical protein